MSFRVINAGDKIFTPAPTSVRPYEHARWYFISRPIPEVAPPVPIRILSENIIYHYAASPADPSNNIIVGYCHLKLRMCSDNLEALSGPSYQWIPAIFANNNQAVLGVDFTQWRKDDFDIDSFVQLNYPWDLVSSFILKFVSQLLLFPTLCS